MYLDYAATTPISANALQAYNRAAVLPGNAASVHRAGQQARELLEEGRTRIAAALKVNPLELIFNSGATEGNNQVVLSVAAEYADGHLITSAIEHPAVLAPMRALEARGFAVTYLSPDINTGQISPEQLQAALRPDTRLVSIMHSNNEVGCVQDIAALCAVAKAAGVRFHTDAVQSLGALAVDVAAWGVDYATFSAHKCYGPKGFGVLYVRRGLDIAPMLLGGKQEKGLRSGTHNIAGAYASGVAIAEAVEAQPQTERQLRVLQAYLQDQLQDIQGVTFNHPTDGTGNPKIVSLSLADVDGEALMMNLDIEGIYASAGSACSAGAMQGSHVLAAFGRNQASLRLSLSAQITLAELDVAAKAVRSAIERSRFSI